MATRLQRVQSIADAVINGTASNALMTRMVDGNLGLSPAEVATKTSAQKADIFFQKLRDWLLMNVKGYEAQVAVRNAQTATYTQVDTDFTEAP